MTQYAIRNTQYIIPNTQYSILNTQYYLITFKLKSRLETEWVKAPDEI
jgi:hypothetical protein